MQKGFFGIIFLIIAVCTFITAAQCRKRKEAMAGITGLVCLFGAFSVLFNSITLLTNQEFVMTVFYSLQFVCIDFLVFFILDYTVQLAEFGRLKPVYKIITGILFCADSVMLLANPWTNLVFEYEQYVHNSDLYFKFVPEFWFYIHLVICYVILLAVAAVLVVKVLRIPLVYAGRYLLELGALVLIAVFNLLFLFNSMKIDISCILYAFTVWAAYQIALDYRPSFLRKQARYMMVNKLQEPIVLFDINDQLADFNAEAAEKFNLQDEDLCRLTRREFESNILQLTYEEHPDYSINREVVFHKEYAVLSYRVTMQALKSQRGLDMGKMYVFQDVTKQKMMYNALENMSAYDQLTGFYTGRAFENKLEEWNKEPEEYIVAICNIAGLKLINAFYNRVVGSSIIQKMSETLRDVLPEDALVCYADDDSTVIVAKGITEDQMNLYLSNAARKLKKRGLDNIPIFLNYGVARRENTAVSIEEYIKYAVMDLLIKKGKDSAEQKREMTKALTEEYFRNEYESLEHVNRIKELSVGLADKLGLKAEDKEKLELLCCYHDIGRVRTREEVWSRAAVITRDELDIIKLHSITGYQIVAQMQLKYDIADLVLYHHENYDGSGYPYGLDREKIPMLSRILAIVDSYDVMVNDQLYKGAVSEKHALEELRKHAGSQFDPELVNLFEEYLKESK